MICGRLGPSQPPEQSRIHQPFIVGFDGVDLVCEEEVTMLLKRSRREVPCGSSALEMAPTLHLRRASGSIAGITLDYFGP